MKIFRSFAYASLIVLIGTSANAATTYSKANRDKVPSLRQAVTSGTCDFGVINDIVDWVVRRDPDASRKFQGAVHKGARPYQALQDQLGHDQNALSLVQKCQAEAMLSLANHGFGG
jgi:hypothetical protein